MESIFHEKQEGLLCAQHCLNALLQGAFFTPVDLAMLAQKMDDEERLRMAESGIDTEEYRRFIEQPSGNMDDSGYFSVQVISSALEVWGLELVPFNSSDPLSREANLQPESMSAYICNYRDHWFTIRKLGHQWFNLNSLLSKPQLVSNTYLSILLAQLQQEGEDLKVGMTAEGTADIGIEGYSIFIVKGSLPSCPADELLKITPAAPEPKPYSKKDTPKSQQDSDLEKAIKLSLGEEVDPDEEELEAALRLSLAEEASDPSLRRAIHLSLALDSAQQPNSEKECRVPSGGSPDAGSRDLSGSEGSTPSLEAALRLSMEGHESLPAVEGSQASSSPRVYTIPITVEPRESSSSVGPTLPPSSLGGSLDVEEIRRRRLAYIDNRGATES